MLQLLLLVGFCLGIIATYLFKGSTLETTLLRNTLDLFALVKLGDFGGLLRRLAGTQCFDIAAGGAFSGGFIWCLCSFCLAPNGNQHPLLSALLLSSFCLPGILNEWTWLTDLLDRVTVGLISVVAIVALLSLGIVAIFFAKITLLSFVLIFAVAACLIMFFYFAFGPACAGVS